MSHRAFRCLIVAMLMMMHFGVSASEFSAIVRGERFQWESLGTVSEGMAPSYWDLPLNLPVAQSVIPGGVANASSQTLLVSSNGSTVSLPITIKGMVYRVSSVTSSMNDASGNAVATIAGNEVTVVGTGAGKLRISLSQVESPITHFRPLISTIDEDAWEQAFKSVGAEKGVYNGSLPIVATYDYFRNGIRIRNTLTFALSVSIDYAPQFINTLEVDGLDSMTLEYHPGFLVSGKTSYDITATGYFNNGIQVGLIAPTNGYFSLIASGDNVGKEIRYSVRCSLGCESNQDFILEGEPQINTSSSYAVISGTDPTRATARLDVTFEPVSLHDYKGDIYRGQFVLVFEARL